jgi:hypothetical protein
MLTLCGTIAVMSLRGEYAHNVHTVRENGPYDRGRQEGNLEAVPSRGNALECF